MAIFITYLLIDMEDIVREFIKNREYEEVSLYCFPETQSFYFVGITKEGKGFYVIVMGSVFDGKILSCQTQVFNTLTKYNIFTAVPD